jgi:hypothetical protein
MRLYRAILSPLLSPLEAEIEERSNSLRKDMELRNLAEEIGDWESVEALEFRMRETYGELLPRVVTKGLIGLMPHLLVLCALYAWLPEVSLLGDQVSTVKAYILVGLAILAFSHWLAWRRRAETIRYDVRYPRVGKEMQQNV